MAMLSEAGIQTINVYVLNPKYVKKNAQGSPVARASWLDDFNDSSNFDANDRGIFSNVRVRGVRLAFPVGDAPEKGLVPSAPLAPSEITPIRCYDTLLADEKSAVAALDDARAAGLSRILASYLTTKAQ